MENSCVREAVARLRSHLFLVYMFVCVCVCLMAHCLQLDTFWHNDSLRLLLLSAPIIQTELYKIADRLEHLRFNLAGCSDANEGKLSCDL